MVEKRDEVPVVVESISDTLTVEKKTLFGFDRFFISYAGYAPGV